MQNPWSTIAPEWVNQKPKDGYILDSDRSQVFKFNEHAKEQERFILDLLPEPYLGEPDAPIFLLNKNPGFGEEDYAFYKMNGVVHSWQNNILHQPQEYPFYLLNPDYVEINGGKWWSAILKPLIALTNAKTVAARVCCMEFFPYHSRSFDRRIGIVPSQEYNFHLVRRAIAQGTVIVVMRGLKDWQMQVPELQAYKHRYTLNSPQNVTVSERNCPKGFAEIKRLLSA